MNSNTWYVDAVSKDLARDHQPRGTSAPIGETRTCTARSNCSGRAQRDTFADFNGRVTRVFIDLLTRRLNLLDVDPILDPGEPSERYIRALRAADVDNWQPLVEIWKERLEQEDSGAAE